MDVFEPAQGTYIYNLKENDLNEYAKLVDFVVKMLDYGSKAQLAFGVLTGDLANSILKEYEDINTDTINVKIKSYSMANVDDDMFNAAIARANNNETADDMNDVAAGLGANYYMTTLVYLNNSTLRHYFTKKDSSFKPELYENRKAPYYYVEVTGIAAAKLDELQIFKVGNKEFNYSALDYARNMAKNSNENNSNLACLMILTLNTPASLYWVMRLLS